MLFKCSDLTKATEDTLLAAQEQAIEGDQLRIALIRKISLPFVECVENGKTHLLN